MASKQKQKWQLLVPKPAEGVCGSGCFPASEIIPEPRADRIVVAHGVKHQSVTVLREADAHRLAGAAFIDSPAQGAHTQSCVAMGIAEGCRQGLNRRIANPLVNF